MEAEDKMNTTKRGSVTFLVYKKERDKLYTGVCLDFGIVIEDENLEFVQKELLKAAMGYLETVGKEKMDESLLNNQAPKKYFKIYEQTLKSELSKTKPNQVLNNFRDINIRTINLEDRLTVAKRYAQRSF